MFSVSKSSTGKIRDWTELILVSLVAYLVFAYGGLVLFSIGAIDILDLESLFGDRSGVKFFLLCLLYTGFGFGLVLTLNWCLRRQQPTAKWYQRLSLSRPSWEQVGWAVVAYLGFIIVGVLVMGILVALSGLDPLEAHFGAIERTLVESGGTWSLVWAGLLAVILIPISEELIARRWLFGRLRDLSSFWLAWPVSGLLFGLIHLPHSWVSAVSATVLGLALVWLYHWTGNLWLTIGVHGFHNAQALILVSLIF